MSTGNSEQQELEEQLWEQLKVASETAHDAGLLRIHEGIELLLEVMSFRAKEKYD